MKLEPLSATIIGIVVVIFIASLLLKEDENINIPLENDNQSKVVFSQVSSSNLTPIGVSTINEYVTEETNYLEDHSFVSFGKQSEKIYTSSDIQFSPWNQNIIQKELYIIKEDNIYDIYSWDYSNGAGEKIYSFEEKLYGYNITSLSLSNDKRFLFAIEQYWPVDYNASMQDDDFSYDQIEYTNIIHKIDFINNIDEILLNEVSNRHYNLVHAGDTYLTLSTGRGEADWRHLTFFDIGIKEFVLEISEHQYFESAVTPDGCFIAYTDNLFSKAGNFDPSSIRIYNTETLDMYNDDWLSQYDFGIQYSEDGYQVGDIWVEYNGLYWDTDNHTLYTMKTASDLTDNKKDNYIYSIDFANKNIEEVIHISNTMENPYIKGVFQGRIYLSTTNNSDVQLWLLPDSTLLGSYDLKNSIKLVVI